MDQSKTPDIQEIEANVKAVLKGLSICLIDDSRAFCAGVRELLAPYSVNLHIFQDPAVAFPKLPGFRQSAEPRRRELVN